LEKAPVLAVEPTGETVPLAEVVQPPPVQTASLPKTASDLPLLALIGLLSLGAGFSVRTLCAR
jgi:LPXTG-motif cell wall-anchored protein